VELIGRVREILAEGGIEAAEQEARWLVLAATGIDRGDLDESLEIGEERAAIAEALAHRRVDGEPLQYLTGIAGFRYLELAVGPGVMIPRPETEVVAERAMARLPKRGTVVDCGTGSGAIALSIAHERPDATAFATERSPVAMAWAEKNRAALGLGVRLIACDLLAGLPAELRRSVDVVVTNPPYVATSERELLARDVVQHEPHEALFAGPHGLDVIRRLADDVPAWLRPGGWLVLEIGESQADDVDALLHAGGYANVRVHPDLTGRPRVVEARAAS
jgi:release factor glutamine methyltransferase